MENEVKLSIEGMHCDACVRRVTNALQGFDGVRIDSVKVGSAKIAYQPKKVALEQIAAAIVRIGFKARIER